MNKLISTVQKRITPLATYISNNSYLQTIKSAFELIMPFIVGSSFFSILKWVILDPNGIIMGSPGINLGYWITGYQNEMYLQSNFVSILNSLQDMCDSIILVTYGLFSLFLVITFAYKLAQLWNNENPIEASILALICYILLIPSSITENMFKTNAIPYQYLGSNSIFGTIIITTFVLWVYNKLRCFDRIKLKLPEELPPTVGKSFSNLIPIIITLLIVVCLKYLLMALSLPNIHQLTINVIEKPIMGMSQNLGFALLYQFVIWFLWWFGIHGSSITSIIQNIIYIPAQISNQTGVTSYIFTNGFFEATLLHILALPIAIFMVSKRKEWKTISKLSLPSLIFNIEEPLSFGLPIILNPLFIIPYILNPLINTLIGWLLISLEILPVFKYIVTWTMPPILSGILSTGSLMGGLFQLLILTINVIVYIPFVLTANNTTNDTHINTEKR